MGKAYNPNHRGAENCEDRPFKWHVGVYVRTRTRHLNKSERRSSATLIGVVGPVILLLTNIIILRNF